MDGERAGSSRRMRRYSERACWDGAAMIRVVGRVRTAISIGDVDGRVRTRIGGADKVGIKLALADVCRRMEFTSFPRSR